MGLNNSKSEEEKESEVLNQGEEMTRSDQDTAKLLLILFCESNCRDCSAVRESFRNLAGTLDQSLIISMEADVNNGFNNSAVISLDVTLAPTFVLVRDKVEVDRIVTTDIGQVQDMIRRNMNKNQS